MTNKIRSNENLPFLTDINTFCRTIGFHTLYRFNLFGVISVPPQSVIFAEHNFFILKDICWYQMVQTNMITMIMCIEYGISISYD